MTLKQFKPLGHRLLLLMDRPDDRSAGGIALPQSHHTNQRTGIVVRTGTKDTGGIKQGDKVMVSKHGGTDFEIGSRTYRLFMAAEVLAIL